MSSPTQYTLAPVLEQRHHVNLIYILRQANQRYQHVADDTRASISRTHHARRLAARKGLQVDIHKAVNCPQKFISLEPLPVIEICSPVGAPVFISKSAPALAAVEARREEPRVPRLTLTTIMPMIPTIVIPAVDSERRLVAHLEEMCVDNSMSSRFSVSPEEIEFDDVDISMDDDLDSWSATDSDESEYSDISLATSGFTTPEDLVPMAMSIQRKPSQVTGMDVLEKRPRLELAA